MNELVSVVIPTYNRALDLVRALKSVIAQTYPHWECIIVDNHSTDNTDELVKSLEDSRIKLFKIHNNGVIAKSRNAGILHAQGKYIAFLDSDDWWSPQKLKRSLDCFEQGADVVYHDLQCIKKINQKFFTKKVPCRALLTSAYSDLICNGNALPNSSVVLRVELLHQINGLSEDPELIAAEDYECWLRVSKLTDKFVYIPAVLGYYWIGGSSESNPMRSLVYLKRLQALHILPYITVSHLEMPLWWDYALARACYLIGERVEAKCLLQQAVHRSLPALMQLKVRFMLLRMNLMLR